jgi:hypothetical protein
MRLLAFVKKRLKPAVGRSSPEDKPSARIEAATSRIANLGSTDARGNFVENPEVLRRETKSSSHMFTALTAKRL